MVELPPHFDGARVRLRPYQAGDGLALYEAVIESREDLLPWMVWARGHICPEESEIVVRRGHANWEARTDLTMGIFERETGRFLGGTGLHRIDWDIPSFEIGYWVRSSAVGNGYATESVQVLTRYAFESLGAKRVHLRIATDNVRSMAIPPRLGFVHEGTYRNSLVDADGLLHDAASFAMIPEDWDRVNALS